VSDGAADDNDASAPVEAPAPAVRHGVPVVVSHGQEELHPSRDRYLDVVRALVREDGFRLCLSITGVDYLTHSGRSLLPAEVAPERFEVVVHLLSLVHRERLRLRVQVPGDEPSIPSLYDVFPGCEAHEREVYDMFGIRFEGHPDLTRILMPEDWEGHPLRKDYAIGRIPVQFKGAPGPR
jgi:NADH-quinone oxidoreductase subunit C